MTGRHRRRTTWDHLRRSSTFWLYVGMGLVCVGAVAGAGAGERGGVPWVAWVPMAVGLLIEYLAVRPTMRRWRALVDAD